MNCDKLDKFAAAFLKKAQVLEPGTSEKAPRDELISDKQMSFSKILRWLDTIKNAARPLSYGWSKPVAQNVLQAIADQKANPIEYAAVQMDMPDGKTALGWAVLDINNNYYDLINVLDFEKTLRLFL